MLKSKLAVFIQVKDIILRHRIYLNVLIYNNYNYSNKKNV